LRFDIIFEDAIRGMCMAILEILLYVDEML